jgi:hypothetical protein
MRAAGPVESGPGHNTSYKRAVLHSYRDELEPLYQSERNFHYRLKKDGHRFLAEPRAELAHINISLPRKILGHAFFGGVLFGQYRLAGMSFVERVARTIIAPFVPPIRFWRMARTLGFGRYVSPGTPRAAFIVAPVLLAIHATGEVVGYWRLLRDIEARYEHYELHRSECVQPIERPLMTARS